jgi:hypothetical protein
MRRSNHADKRAIFGHQHVASPYNVAARQEYTELAALRVRRGKTAFLAHIPVELNGGGAFEEGRREALALRQEFGGGEHAAD